MKESRGEFRGIRVCIIDGKDFQQLSPEAKLVFYTLKLRCGQAGICVVPALFASLEEQTGLDYEQIGGAVNQLTGAGWVKIERNIVWIIDGLKHEPSYFAGNPKHQTHLRRYLDTLPRLAIVEEFRKYYAYLPGLEPIAIPAVIEGSTVHKLPAKKPPKPPAEPKATWVQEGTVWWQETVGTMAHARFGAALKSLVDAHGWEKVKAALIQYTVEQQGQGKTIKLEWFASEGAARVARLQHPKLSPANSKKPWEQDEYDLGLARNSAITDRVKAYKKSLNGEGEAWWTTIVQQAKSLNRHPVALAFERLPSEHQNPG